MMPHNPDDKVRERVIANYLKKFVKKLGGKAVKIKGEGHNGIPDYLVALDGGLYLVETKRPKNGVLSEIQKWVHIEYAKRGIKVYTCFTKKEVDKFIYEICFS